MAEELRGNTTQLKPAESPDRKSGTIKIWSLSSHRAKSVEWWVSCYSRNQVHTATLSLALVQRLLSFLLSFLPSLWTWGLSLQCLPHLVRLHCSCLAQLYVLVYSKSSCLHWSSHTSSSVHKNPAKVGIQHLAWKCWYSSHLLFMPLCSKCPLQLLS